MVVMIVLVSVFGFLVAAMAVAPVAAGELERVERAQRPTRGLAPVPVASRRPVVVLADERDEVRAA